MKSDSAPLRRRDTLDALARRALDDDDVAFEALHDRLCGGLRAFFVRRVGAREELVEELAQATWVAAWRALHENRYNPDRAAFTTFLYAVGYKTWLQHRRIAARDVPLDDDPASVFSHVLEHNDDPAAWLAVCELLDATRDCLRTSLNEEERAILDGLTAGETERTLAESLGIAPSTAHARKLKAMDKVRKCLEAKRFH
jgi:RNA polymerase sigma factor (sigma-70 family)